MKNWKIYNQMLANRGKVVTVLIQPSLMEQQRKYEKQAGSEFLWEAVPRYRIAN